jgi:hypothetical protein
MCEDGGLLRILGKEVRRVVQEVVVPEGILLHGVEVMIENCAILSVLLMRAIWCRRIHLARDDLVTWSTVT